MQTATLNRLLDQLDEVKRRFGPGSNQAVLRILNKLARASLNDIDTLVRFHEILLFISAYPQSLVVRNLSNILLKSFPKRLNLLRDQLGELAALETPEISGIADTSVTDTFTYPIVKWLVERHPRSSELAWDWFEDENRLADIWPRLMPLLAEDASVEANVPYLEWLKAARGRHKELPWLIERFAALEKSEQEKAELFNSQKLYVRWTPPYPATRTGMRLRRAGIYYHSDPLIRRKDVSLKAELEQPAPNLKRLTRKRGIEILNLACEASTARYRELYGFTHGDSERVFQTDLGRGVDLFITQLPSERRLPLRAYHAAMIFKNEVPIGYFEGLSLFERMESGFNLYYTFRDGETAWLYARILSVFRHMLGVTAFAIDPYQVGFENEEGIESGAFWFYRKLGFRPTVPRIMRLVLKEEKKMAANADYRTSARTLRQLAEGPMIFELDQTQASSVSRDWDGFQVRKLGLAVTERMGSQFKGGAERFRTDAVRQLNRVLGTSENSWKDGEQTALSDFAVTMSLLNDLNKWASSEKRALVEIIKAKAGTEESRYLKLMQKHARLRQEMIKLGSK